MGVYFVFCVFDGEVLLVVMLLGKKVFFGVFFCINFIFRIMGL